LAESTPQFLQLLDGETAVLGQHGTGGFRERVHDLRDACCLVRPRHGSPSVPGLTRPSAKTKNAPTQASGRRRTGDLHGPGVLTHWLLRRSPARERGLLSVSPGRAAVTTGGLWFQRRTI